MTPYAPVHSLTLSRPNAYKYLFNNVIMIIITIIIITILSQTPPRSDVPILLSVPAVF